MPAYRAATTYNSWFTSAHTNGDPIRRMVVPTAPWTKNGLPAKVFRVLPIIHIGYFKTGTTSLQRNFFGAHQGIWSLSKPAPTKEGVEIFRYLTLSDPTGDDLQAARAIWTRVSEQVPRGKIVVFLQTSR